ncbi:Gfo/Idh/MocA family protein [Treponema pedis]|uniref:Gfo/Idh/MocA family oxidoreductase n=1 Tax=Treponema pedis TaxID=409322 RepID=A0A7S6WR57_9SPIR|nr:Gfo/Idh/MocA family oxidoreductase [Treponema pedis]QOW61707.1 Gfo/Idh/MocA family oxidoreductase [Treponema pedis]
MNKALLIGYGSIGRRHTKILQEKFNFQVDIVTNQHVENHRCFKKLIDVSNINFYDYFLITSPTNLHYEQLVYLNTYLNGKKIFVEKPIFDVPHSVNLNNFVFVGYDLRYSFIIDELKKIIKTRSVMFIQAYVGQYLPTWRKNIDYRDSYSASQKRGGGVLLDLSHELDYIQYLCGSITEIRSYNDKISDLEIDSDDIFTAIAKTETGTIVNVTMDYISKQTMRYCIIHLNDKTIYADFISNSIKVVSIDGAVHTIACENEMENYSYWNMHYDILGSDQLDKKACSFNEAASIMKLVHDIRMV